MAPVQVWHANSSSVPYFLSSNMTYHCGLLICQFLCMLLLNFCNLREPTMQSSPAVIAIFNALTLTMLSSHECFEQSNNENRAVCVRVVRNANVPTRARACTCCAQRSSTYVQTTKNSARSLCCGDRVCTLLLHLFSFPSSNVFLLC